MSFQDVSPGDPWQTEPAVRYNAVNYLLRSFAGEVPEEKEMSDFRLVDFINSSSDTIRAFTAVAIIQDEYIMVLLRNCNPVSAGIPVSEGYRRWMTVVIGGSLWKMCNPGKPVRWLLPD